MSPAANESIVRRYFEEALNNGNLAVIDELFAQTTSITAASQASPSRAGRA